MKRSMGFWFMPLVLLSTAGFASAGEAKAPVVTLTAQPLGYAYVDGDSDKFEAHHWMPEGYTGGLRDFSYETVMPDEVEVLMEGHAIAGANDFGARVRLEKEDAWHALFEYQEFRKYYDRTGGVYYPFPILPHADLDRKPELDIGNLRLEAGLVLENLPDVTFIYEREFREGLKSRLTWTQVTDGATTKSIGPSWQEVDEVTDSFEVRLNDTFNGFDWTASQRWESTDSEYLRQEKSLSTNVTASQRKIRLQDQEPESDLLETVLSAERWFLKDKVFTSNHYRFSQIENSEVESILETNENGVATNFSNPKQIVNATGTNQFRSHTWVGHLLWILTDRLNLTNRLKFNHVTRDSSSFYPADASPNAAGGATPNGVLDQTDVTENDNRLNTWGHSASLRFSGIPRAALYADWDYSQTRNWLSEDRMSSNTGELFSREVVAHLFRGVGTLGARVAPSDWFNATAHYRRRQDDIRYNNIRYTLPTTGAARSVFVDGQEITTDEFATRLSLKPAPWFEPSFRYQYLEKDYETWGIPDDQNKQESRLLSHVYTWDATVNPAKDWLATVAFSLQDARTETPASNSTTTSQAPTFHADVYSWLVSTEYALRENIILNGYFEFSRSANFNDFVAAGGLPLGAEYKELDFGVGVKWTPDPSWTVEPRYDFFQYRPNDQAEYGQYDAHVVWFSVTKQWS